MPFPHEIKETVLVRSRRRCCICHKFSGRNINVHHVIQEARGGDNSINNAIALCFDCHAEAGHYNPAHPLGTKYSPSELLKHRDEWWKYCETHPGEIHELDLNIKFKRIFNSGDIHRYKLIGTYLNSYDKTQEGFLMELFFPYEIPVYEFQASSKELENAASTTVEFNKIPYKKIIRTSSQKIYPGLLIDIFDQEFYIVYEMNDKLFWTDKNRLWKFIVYFYTSDAPKIEMITAWDDMHEF